MPSTRDAFLVSPVFHRETVGRRTHHTTGSSKPTPPEPISEEDGPIVTNTRRRGPNRASFGLQSATSAPGRCHKGLGRGRSNPPGGRVVNRGREQESAAEAPQRPRAHRHSDHATSAGVRRCAATHVPHSNVGSIQGGMRFVASPRSTALQPAPDCTAARIASLPQAARPTSSPDRLTRTLGCLNDRAATLGRNRSEPAAIPAALGAADGRPSECSSTGLGGEAVQGETKRPEGLGYPDSTLDCPVGWVVPAQTGAGRQTPSVRRSNRCGLGARLPASPPRPPSQQGRAARTGRGTSPTLEQVCRR